MNILPIYPPSQSLNFREHSDEKKVRGTRKFMAIPSFFSFWVYRRGKKIQSRAESKNFLERKKKGVVKKDWSNITKRINS